MATVEGTGPERMVADGSASMPGPTAVPMMRLTAAQKLFFSPPPETLASTRGGGWTASVLLHRHRHCRLGSGHGRGGGFLDARIGALGVLGLRGRCPLGEGTAVSGEKVRWRRQQRNMAAVIWQVKGRFFPQWQGETLWLWKTLREGGGRQVNFFYKSVFSSSLKNLSLLYVQCTSMFDTPSYPDMAGPDLEPLQWRSGK